MFRSSHFGVIEQFIQKVDFWYALRLTDDLSQIYHTECFNLI